MDLRYKNIRKNSFKLPKLADSESVTKNKVKFGNFILQYTTFRRKGVFSGNVRYTK